MSEKTKATKSEASTARSASPKKAPAKAKSTAKVAAAKSTKRRVVFEINAGPGKSVGVAGSFNDWNPDAKPLKDRNGDGVYRGIVTLEPGRYEYKFVVDGIWSMDARNPLFAPNDFGTLNSLIVIE